MNAVSAKARKGDFSISAKNLGAIALPDYCPRCFWIQMKMGFNTDKIPFAKWPGVFNSIDKYTKMVVHEHFDSTESAPSWIKSMSPGVVRYLPPPTWHHFSARIEPYDVIVRGSVDGLFQCEDDSFVIVDYKTAKFTATQDMLLPLYKVQLNTYAVIGEATGYDPVSGLLLIYCQPYNDDVPEGTHLTDGFSMKFVPHTVLVERDNELLHRCLSEAARLRDITHLEDIESNPDCKDCGKLARLLEVTAQ